MYLWWWEAFNNCATHENSNVRHIRRCPQETSACWEFPHGSRKFVCNRASKFPLTRTLPVWVTTSMLLHARSDDQSQRKCRCLLLLSILRPEVEVGNVSRGMA